MRAAITVRLIFEIKMLVNRRTEGGKSGSLSNGVGELGVQRLISSDNAVDEVINCHLPAIAGGSGDS